MAIPILKTWQNYFNNHDEGLGSSYERIILNKKLETIIKHFQIEKILEVPSFGFTGVSGINSMQFAKNGQKVTILDNDELRVEKIKKIWKETGLSATIRFNDCFESLPFSDKSFDLSWNFSALWFVQDLATFLAELDRITKKVIFLAVPNRWGIGYLSQKYLGKDDLKKYLKEEYILPKNIKKQMNELGWILLDSNFIDCPPWPDIGMPKEKFLKIFKAEKLLPQKKPEPISILDWYSDNDKNFEKKMLKYSWLEEKAPWIFKRFWAHHRYFCFIKN